jgi:phosphatidylinositol kinase/protein kinase (PI-3  family)
MQASHRATREDWSDWLRRFSVELLRESPSPALRSCAALAQVCLLSLSSRMLTYADVCWLALVQVDHPLARELFNAPLLSACSRMLTYADVC